MADPFAGLTATSNAETLIGGFGHVGPPANPENINDGNNNSGSGHGGFVFQGHQRLTWTFDLGSAQTVAGVPFLAVASYHSQWWTADPPVTAGGTARGGGTLEYASSPSGPWTQITGLSVASLGNLGGNVYGWAATFDGVSARYWRFAWYWYAGGLTGFGGVTLNEVVGEDVASEPEPVPEPSVDFEICGPDGTNCVLFERLVEKKIHAKLNGDGSGHFVISRYDAQATEGNLARGNIVRVTFTEIDPDPIFEFILEEGDFELISSDEEGGELLSFGGPGTLALLRRAILDFEPFAAGWPASVVKPNEGIWSWHDQEAGNILRRLIEEAQERGVLSGVTRTFDNVNDSNGTPWVPMGSWQAPIGANLYDEAMRLVRAGQLHIEMTPGFVLNAYQTVGRDLTGGTFGTDVVRFVKGVNIADSLVKRMVGGLFATNAVIAGEDGTYARAAVVGTPDYIVETFLTAPSTDEDVLEAAGAAALAVQEAAQDAILVPIAPYGKNAAGSIIAGPNDEANGWYYPGPVGTAHGKYWLGDLVTLHTGADEFDFTNTTQRIYGITLAEDPETGELAVPIVELNAPFPHQEEGSASALPAQPSSGSLSGGTVTAAPHTHPYLSKYGGGKGGFLDHGNTGAAEEIDLDDGNAHWLTLDANCTITLVNAAAGVECRIRVALEQGGVGSFTVTWPTIEWVGGSAPTLQTAAGEVDYVDLWTFDGGTTWYGHLLAAPGVGIPASILDAKGDLVGATGADTPARLAVGGDESDLIALAAEATGLKWRKNTVTTANPTVNDDSGDGYRAGSRWLNITTAEEFVCLDATATAAVWKSTTAQGAGSLPTGTTKGDLAVFDGSDWVIVPAGSDDDVLTADAGESAGLKWAPAAGGGLPAAKAWLSGNYAAEDIPASPNATYDDEFDDTTGMSGSGNGLAAKWVWRNQGTGTTAFDKQGYLTLAPNSAANANNWRIIEIAAFADGTYEAKVSLEGVQVLGSSRSQAGGMVIVDATNGDFHLLGYAWDNGTHFYGVQRWTNVTTFNANTALTQMVANMAPLPLFVRIIKSGTTIGFWTSYDGISFIRRHTETDAIGATRIGLGVNENGTTALTKLHVDYFRKVA